MNLKKLIFLTLVSLFITRVSGQTSDNKSTKKEIDLDDVNTYEQHACDSVKKMKTVEDFKEIIRNEFTKVISGSSDQNIGSFASLDVTKANGVFKYTSADSDGRLYTIGANGGIDEGVLDLFSNKNPATNMGLDFTAHSKGKIKVKGFNAEGKIAFSSRDCNEALLKLRLARKEINGLITEARLKLKLDSTLNRIAIDCRNDPCPTIPFNFSDPESCQIRIKLIKTELKKIINKDGAKPDAKLDSVLNRIDKECLGAPCKVDSTDKTGSGYCYLLIQKIKLQMHPFLKDTTVQKRALDSLFNFMAINCNNDKCLPCGKNPCISRADSLRYQYNTAQYALAKLKLDKRVDSLKKALKKREKELSELEVKVLKLSWWSLGGSFKNNSFKLLNESDTIIKTQLSKKSGNVFSFNFSYNYYSWRAIGFSQYFNIGGIIKASDNFDALTKKDVTDTYKLTNGPITREYKGNVTAYTGNYKAPHLIISAFGNAYFFLFKNKAAIHLMGDVSLDSKNNTDLDFDRPIYNALFGLLLCPIDAKDKTKRSVQNVELFVKIKDLFNGLKSENPDMEKAQIGLRFTTPINFK